MWCGVVCCGFVWCCGVAWCGVVLWCGVVCWGVVLCCCVVLWCGAVLCTPTFLALALDVGADVEGRGAVVSEIEEVHEAVDVAADEQVDALTHFVSFALLAQLWLGRGLLLQHAYAHTHTYTHTHTHIHTHAHTHIEAQ